MPTERDEEPLSRVLYGIECGQRCVAVTGPAGSRKSRLLRHVQFALNLAEQVVVTLDATGLTRAEFATRLAAEATATYRPSANSWQHIADVLHGWHATGTTSLWIIDQMDDAADDLCGDLWRLIRLMDYEHAAGTVLFATCALPTLPSLRGAIEFAISLDRHPSAAAA